MPSYSGELVIPTGPLVKVSLRLPQAHEVSLLDAALDPVSPQDVWALIDTGAYQTAIRPRFLYSLQIPEIDQVWVNRTPGTREHCPVYPVRLVFPNGMAVETGAVAIENPLSGIDCLIGWDILKQGTFWCDGPRGEFTLTLPECP